MVELFEQERREEARLSSKGNQLKWKKDGYWYKADYTGYEGLAEYMVSYLLNFSSLERREYVLYETEEIRYGQQNYTGCRSRDFLTDSSGKPDGKRQMITLERLFYQNYGESLYQSIFRIRDYGNRLKFLVEQTERMTGLADFGTYMSKLLTIDAVFLNEDRHTQNIAVLWDGEDDYDYCPLFAQGAALLADTVMDYPLGQDVIEQMSRAEAKTFCRSFDEQLDAAQDLYGEAVSFSYGEREIRQLLEADTVYPEEIKQRVYTILLQQRRKYQYMFA